jgi:hypothetical protein
MNELFGSRRAQPGEILSSLPHETPVRWQPIPFGAGLRPRKSFWIVFVIAVPGWFSFDVCI